MVVVGPPLHTVPVPFPDGGHEFEVQAPRNGDQQREDPDHDDDFACDAGGHLAFQGVADGHEPIGDDN